MHICRIAFRLLLIRVNLNIKIQNKKETYNNSYMVPIIKIRLKIAKF